METTENAGIGRHVVGVRALPKLKQELLNEASSRGITLSEHCETILANRHLENKELENLRDKVLALQNELESLNAAIITTPEPTKAPTILSDKRLLYLLEQLQGKSDTVTNAYGDDFAITYNTPDDVLTAIIYSTKLKT